MFQEQEQQLDQTSQSSINDSETNNSLQESSLITRFRQWLFTKSDQSRSPQRWFALLVLLFGFAILLSVITVITGRVSEPGDVVDALSRDGLPIAGAFTAMFLATMLGIEIAPAAIIGIIVWILIRAS